MSPEEQRYFNAVLKYEERPNICCDSCREPIEGKWIREKPAQKKSSFVTSARGRKEKDDSQWWVSNGQNLCQHCMSMKLIRYRLKQKTFQHNFYREFGIEIQPHLNTGLKHACRCTDRDCRFDFFKHVAKESKNNKRHTKNIFERDVYQEKSKDCYAIIAFWQNS